MQTTSAGTWLFSEILISFGQQILFPPLLFFMVFLSHSLFPENSVSLFLLHKPLSGVWFTPWVLVLYFKHNQITNSWLVITSNGEVQYKKPFKIGKGKYYPFYSATFFFLHLFIFIVCSISLWLWLMLHSSLLVGKHIIFLIIGHMELPCLDIHLA